MYKVRAVLINRAMTWMRVVEQVASPMSTVLRCWRSMSTSTAISRPSDRAHERSSASSFCVWGEKLTREPWWHRQPPSR